MSLYLKKTLTIAKRQFQNLSRALELIRQASASLSIIWLFLIFLQGIIPGFIVYISKILVDQLVSAMGSQGDWGKVINTITLVAITGLVLIISEISQSLLEIIRSAQADIIQDHVKNLVHLKSAEIDLAYFESPDYHDRLEQATTDGTTRPLSLLESIGGLLQNSITLLVMGGLLIQYSLWLPLVLLAGTLPAFLIILHYDRQYRRWWKKTTSDRRWTQYFDFMLTNSVVMPEVRVFNLYDHFRTKYQQLRTDLRKVKIRQMRRLGTAKLLASLFSLGILALALGYMGWRSIFTTALTLGDLALFYQAFSRGQGIIRSLFSSFGQVINNTLYIEGLFEYLDLVNNLIDPDEPIPVPSDLSHGISIENLFFKYPESEIPVLRNFSLFIPAKRCVAIVGENGSGKSTLLKLLCRFYDPDAGTIKFDGINIKSFVQKDFRQLLTVMFQTPLYYNMKVREAISLDDPCAQTKQNEIETAAQGAGAHEFISLLPKGYDTMLGREYTNGTDLSGGQWQRLAMARAYFRRSPIVLLDEPTSFLDPWSEADWYERFHKLTNNQTSVVITHRLNIAMHADFIVVMDQGQIVESGTHAELLAFNGLYASTWNEQRNARIDKREGYELPTKYRYNT